MKKRNGFVSNSSSSSFVLIMKEISVEGIGLKYPDNIRGVFARGDYDDEGCDFFHLDDPMKCFIVNNFYSDKNKKAPNLTFYLVYWMSKSEGDIINKGIWTEIGNVLPKCNVDIEPMEISYHITSSPKELRRRYFPEIDKEESVKEQEIETYNKLKEDIEKDKQKILKMEEELKEKQKKLKIKE